jgi:hypothetical protein
MKILVLAFVLALAACSFRSERTVQNPPPAAVTTTTGATTVTTPAAPATTTVYTR